MIDGLTCRTAVGSEAGSGGRSTEGERHCGRKKEQPRNIQLRSRASKIRSGNFGTDLVCQCAKWHAFVHRHRKRYTGIRCNLDDQRVRSPASNQVQQYRRYDLSERGAPESYQAVWDDAWERGRDRHGILLCRYTTVEATLYSWVLTFERSAGGSLQIKRWRLLTINAEF